MSSEFAFSETTPLRENDCNNGISKTTAIAVANLRNNSVSGDDNNSCNGVTVNHNSHVLNSNNTTPTNNNSNGDNNRNRNNINLNGRNTGVVTVQLETGLNSNYNGFGNRILRQSSGSNNQYSSNNNGDRDNAKMNTNRQIIMKIASDFAILLCVGLPILCFFLFGEPYKRGFFCDDESLKHPFHESTVKNYVLYMMGLVLPLFIIIPIEFFQGRRQSIPAYRFMDLDIPSWMVESYKQIGMFLFGAGSQQLVVDIAKYSVGRLRPHFINVCDPIMPGGTKCGDPINNGVYIENFTCISETSTQHMIKEMRLSFPSGHSSFSAFTMVYCMIYLQSRMNWRGSKLLKHFLQLILFSLTWFTALSRISDYKHHWSDVLAGATIGIIFAILVSQCVANLSRTNFKLPRTQNDIINNSHTIIPVHQPHRQQNNHSSGNGNGHS